MNKLENAPLLICNSVNKSYQSNDMQTTVLYDLSFQLQHAEMAAIIGSSGSGKSTLLHILAGLDTPTTGEVIFAGFAFGNMSTSESAALRNKQLGFVYQMHHLLADFNALENVAMPLRIGGIGRRTALARAQEMLEQVGLGHRLYYAPAALSGGERQRVAIARALVNQPALVLADEPTGNLDYQNAQTVFQLLLDLNLHCRTAFLLVTHDRALAQRLPRQLELIDGRLREVTATTAESTSPSAVGSTAGET